jgi:hypothetical protein
MKFKSIDNKKIKDDKVRLGEPYVIFPEETQTIATHIVTADEVCRIDMISKIYYNDEDASELILKFNNISNPFSINEGDVLNIPPLDIKFKAWKTIKEAGTSKETSIKDQFIDSKRLTVKDAGRASYLKKKAAEKQNGSTQIVPPNILKDGEKNIDINGDTIIL